MRRDIDRAELLGGEDVTAVIRRVDGQVTEAGDASLALETVRRYLAAERARSRRIVVWTSTIFIFVVLTVLTLFVAVGIYVVRNSRETTAVVDRVEQQTRHYAARTEAVVGRVDGIEVQGREVAEAVKATEAAREGESRMFKGDLERFGQWVTARHARRDETIETVAARLEKMERLVATRERQLAAIERRYAAALAQGGDVPAPAVSESVLLDPEAVRIFGAAAPTAGSEPWSPPVVADPDHRPASRSAAIEPVHRQAGHLRQPGQVEPDTAPTGAVRTLSFPNGDRYEGEVAEGLMHGWGVYRFANGDRYEGQFREDSKEGYGVLYFQNGDVYKGDFDGDRRHGRGTYLFANGARYVGDFRDGRRHGHGRYIYEDGREYIGHFRDGQIDGAGFSVAPGVEPAPDRERS